MATDLAAVSKRLPPDLRVRVSEDADIERVVEFQNRWATPGSWMSPASARRAHEVSPEPNRLTLIVEDRTGAIQSVGSTGNGGLFASPDGSWRVGLRVAPEWRRRAVARSLLEQLDDHARANTAKRLVAAVRGDEPDGAGFAEAVGFRKFHERIDAYSGDLVGFHQAHEMTCVPAADIEQLVAGIEVAGGDLVQIVGT